jgi:hypothetical protein
MLVRLKDSYVVADDEVKLTVEIGEGQKGFVEVLLDGMPIGQGDGITDLPIGPGPKLGGRKLRVTSTVTDTNKDTNNTSVTYTLKGGRQTQSYHSRYEVEAPGGTVDYDAIFLLL